MSCKHGYNKIVEDICEECGHDVTRKEWVSWMDCGEDRDTCTKCGYIKRLTSPEIMHRKSLRVTMQYLDKNELISDKLFPKEK